MRPLVLPLLGLLGLALPAVHAAEPASPRFLEHPVHADEGLPDLAVDATRTLAQAHAEALQRAPGLSALAARSLEAQALAARGRGYSSAAPSFALRQQSDTFQAGSGLHETEAGLEVSLWRWGQRRAQQHEAQAADAQALLEASEHSWTVAGEVRERYWALVEAREQVAVAARDLAAFEQLEQDVATRVAAGDAAPLERLTAEGQRREREAALHEAEVRLADAAFNWRVLTGGDRLPAAPAETAQEVPLPYPPLARAQAETERARRTLELARADGAGAPRLLLGARSEAGGAGSGPAVDSLGATLTLPFGGSAHRAVALSGPQLDLARSEDQQRQAEREAVLTRHEAEHELHAREKALEFAVQRLALASDEIRLARRAYQVGETSLAERLLSEIRSSEATRHHALALIARNRALSRYNHVQGVLP